jgi:hypothetical protein
MINGRAVELIKLDIKTPKNMNINYLGFVSGFKRCLAITETMTINNVFDIAEIKEAPACIKLEYKIVLDKL